MLTKGVHPDFQNINEDKKTPLYVAIENDNMICVQLLIFNRASVSILDEKGQNAFHHAVNCGNTILLNFLIKNLGKEVISVMDIKDHDGQTPMVIFLKRFKKFN